MKRMFIGSLPASASEQSVQELFAEYGTVRHVEVAKDIFSGKCRGFGFVEMEGHEAREAIAGLDGKMIEGKPLRVRFEDPKHKKGGRGRGRR